MLVLSRRIGEGLMIGDAIQVTVLSIKGNHVRMGIDAPLSIPVHREEIYLKVKKEEQGGFYTNRVKNNYSINKTH